VLENGMMEGAVFGLIVGVFHGYWVMSDYHLDINTRPEVRDNLLAPANVVINRTNRNTYQTAAQTLVDRMIPKSAKLFVEYYRSTCETVNRRLTNATVAYGAAGTDISGALLATAFRTAYFIDREAISYAELKSEIEQWTELKPNLSYFTSKFKKGFANKDDFRGKREFFLVQELQALGVQKKDVSVSTENGRVVLRFKLAGERRARKIIDYNTGKVG
jgi:hypothetical protein